MKLLQGLAGCLGLAFALAAASQTWEGDKIKRPLTDRPGDVQRGKSIVLGRQLGFCLLCHSGPFPDERFQGNLAPDLKQSLVRLSEGQIRARLVDPSKLNPETIMPSYFKSDHLKGVASPYLGKTILTAQEIEDVVAFLITIK